MMKIYLYGLISILLLSNKVNAQQDQLYTQFAFNKLAFNPAYAGNNDYLSVTGIYRDQWNGFPGAPDAQVLSVDLPRFSEKVGIGFNLERQSIGISRNLTFTANYAYKVFLEEGTLSLGLSTSLRNLMMDFTDPRLFAVQGLENDGSINVDVLNKNLLNAGFGAYYNNEKYYVGLSIPRLIKSDLELGNDNDNIISNEVRHLYFMAGASLPINERLDFKPQFLMRWAENTPLTIDLNGGLLLDDKYNFAMTFRSGGGDGNIGESIDLMLGLNITDQFMIGFAHDFTLSDLRSIDSGSVELLMTYSMVGGSNKIKVANPRFF